MRISDWSSDVCSRPTAAIDAVPALYGQARTALTVGRRISGPWTVTQFDDLGVYRLLSLVEDENELETFARETLRELTEETAEAQDMRKTLEVDRKSTRLNSSH